MRGFTTEAAGMEIGLIVLSAGKWQGKAIAVAHLPFVVGRDAGCNLRLSSAYISKQHCALCRRGDKVFVEDLNSTNGTFVNDRQLQGAIQLVDGDRIQIGPLRLSVNIPGKKNEGSTDSIIDQISTSAEAVDAQPMPEGGAEPGQNVEQTPKAKTADFQTRTKDAKLPSLPPLGPTANDEWSRDD